jgi:ATP-dependent helicase/DNAse subunit B
LPVIQAICGELHNHLYILDRLKKALQTKNFSLRVVFPTLSLLNEIQDELLNQPEVAGVGGIRLLLFEGFIKEMGQQFALQQLTPSALTRDLLISEAFELLKRQGKLDYLGKAPFSSGYRQAVLAGIAEWKRSCLTPELFTHWAVSKGEKEQQLALLYQAYQQLLVQKGYSEEDLTLCQLNEFKQKNELPAERSVVILYGFTDLTPLQTKFIKTLEIWFDFEILLDPTPVPEIRNFISGRFSLANLPELPKPVVKNALSKLQGSFWNEEPQPQSMAASDDSLQLLQTAGWAKQATAIAREIITLLRENSTYQVEDFLILAPQPQAFMKAALPIFSEYHLPLQVGAVPIGEYPGIKCFSQALAAYDADWQWPEMEVFIRQQYAGHLAAEGDRVLLELGERYGALSGKERWLHLLKNKDFYRYFLEKGLDLNPLQKGMELLESIHEVARLKDYLELVRNYFSTALAAAVQYVIASQDDLEQHMGNIKAMQQLVETLDEVAVFIDNTQLCENEMSLREFQNFWRNYLLALEVKLTPPSEAVIKVLVPKEARGIRRRVVFITGLEQGVFPRNYINDWKLSLKDRRELQTLGVELETGEHYQTQEKLAFYWALQTAEERLYLVHQEQDSSGQPLNHSPYLDEVRQWFPDLLAHTKRYPLAPEPPLSFAECCSSFEQNSYLTSHLMVSTAETSDLTSVTCLELLQNPVYQQLAMQIWQEYSWRMGLDYQFFNKPASTQLLAKIFGESHTFAITALEDYHSCPYRFFLKQLLKVKPLIKPQLLPDNLDLGNLYHQVLQEFAEPFRGQNLTSERGQEYRQALNECFHDFYREWQQNAANDLVKLVLSLQKTQIWGILERWLKSELDWATESAGRFKICFLEFGFGLLRGDFDPASLPHPYQFEAEATNIKIWGKIDRIDADAEGNFVVYDYKSGRGPATKDLLQVDYLQIPLYLLALEELYFGAGKAVGGSYLGLKEPSRSRGGVWHSDRLGMVLGGKCLLEDTEWQEWLAKVKISLGSIVQNIRNGVFYPTGQECLPFCEYTGCCRQSEREVEQVDEISAESSTS